MTAGINELQPLLHDIHDQRPYDSECQPSCEHRAVKRPLPAAQLTTLCLLRLSDPIAFTQIFPYVNEMMERFGVATDPSQTGFYSGLVVSHCIPPPPQIERTDSNLTRKVHLHSLSWYRSTIGPVSQVSGAGADFKESRRADFFRLVMNQTALADAP